MPSEKVRRALLSKTNLPEAAIDAMTEGEAWQTLREAPTPKRKPDKSIRVCFTGFRASEKENLEDLADRNGHIVTSSVTKKLTLLVCGDNAGPAKQKKAAEQGVEVLSEQAYRQRIAAA